MGTEVKQTANGPDAISEELYAAVANLGRDREQKIVTASASGEEGLLHYLAYKHDGNIHKLEKIDENRRKQTKSRNLL